MLTLVSSSGIVVMSSNQCLNCDYYISIQSKTITEHVHVRVHVQTRLLIYLETVQSRLIGTRSPQWWEMSSS